MSNEHRSSGNHSSFIERARELALLRDLAIINERTYHELGPAPVASTSTESRPKPKMTHNHALTNLALSAEVKEQEYGDEESMKPHRIAVAALVASGTLTACGTNVAPADGSSAPPKPPIATENSAAKPAANSDLTSERIDAIIKQVMDQQYGQSIDAKAGCWKHTSKFNDQSVDYCMKPRRHEIVSTDHGTILYFFASNTTDENDRSYRYTLLDFGLMGAFEIKIDSPEKWSLLSSGKELASGSAGDCGCGQADFVKLGKHRYGWIFVSGAMWQGVSVSWNNIVSSYAGQVIDLSEIPNQTESDQDTEHQVKVDASDSEKESYPLLVTEVKHGKPFKTIVVNFDESRGRYALSE